MYIATVIPIARGIPFDVLTYYAAAPLRAGTLVLIPLGKQKILGLVTETIPLSEAKAYIKSASFALKKILTVYTYTSYFGALTEAFKQTGVQTLAPIGAVAAAVLPQSLFEYLPAEKIQTLLPPAPPHTIPIYSEQSVLGPQEERVATYKRMIRSAFAQKQSVLFIAPTIRSITHWHTELSKGIGRHTVIFHSKVGKKILRSQFAAIKHEQIPRVYFVTPGFSALPIGALGTIIIEEESSTLYHSSDRYNIDTRFFYTNLAKALQSALVFGDTLPRFEILHRTGQTHLPRTFIPDKLRIVPIEPYRTILPGEAIELIRHAQKRKRRLFIYTNRKGIAPLSRCADCGRVVECPSCELPMALRTIKRGDALERQFLCLHCADTLSADHHCTTCGSWNIVPVAIGTESIRDAVAQIVGPELVHIIDEDTTPDSATITELLETVKKQKSAVIIGTQKALPYIDNIGYALLPFFDRLLSTPSMYTTESLLRLLLECNEVVTESVVVCTKLPTFPMIRQLETHKINALIHDELTLREQLGYPPFGTLLKLTVTVPEGYRNEIFTTVTEHFKDLDATSMPIRRVSLGSMKVVLSWLIRVPHDYIEEEGPTLIAFLEKLRFPYTVSQNPERL